MHVHLKPIQEQTIVITGASSGIGLTTARLAAERGANVVLVARNDEALVKEADRLRSEGYRVDHIAADVGEREDMRRVVETVCERHGGFDTWVNNAGVGVYGTIEEISDEDHGRVFQTNYWGVVFGSTEALKHLRTQGGALINIGSISSELPAPILGSYTASKYAVKGFTDSLRLELMHDRAPVSVTLIQPSGIHTPFGEHAKNYREERSQVPPPVYHPILVARAILHAAVHPTRDIIVGESGLAQVRFAQWLPQLADRFFSWAFYKTALDKSHDRREADALHKPGSGGHPLGDQDSHIFRISPYTEMQLRPQARTVLGILALASAGLLIARTLRHRPRW